MSTTQQASGGSFQGRTAVVLGGGAGWGRAVCERLAMGGAEVMVIDADATQVAETCHAITQAGGKAQGVTADISDADRLGSLASEWFDRGRSINVLVTHYMAMDWRSIEDCDVADFERVVVHNLIGPVKAVKAFLPLLKRAAGKAAIVHIGSVDGLHGSPRVPSYSVAKGGLIPLTHIMAYEFAKLDIRVNAIATAQTVQVPVADMPSSATLAFPGFPGPDYMKQLNDATPLKRYGPLTDWAGAVAFLASDDAAYVTGSVLVVDAGRLAITPGTQ